MWLIATAICAILGCGLALLLAGAVVRRQQMWVSLRKDAGILKSAIATCRFRITDSRGTTGYDAVTGRTWNAWHLVHSGPEGVAKAEAAVIEYGRLHLADAGFKPQRKVIDAGLCAVAEILVGLEPDYLIAILGRRRWLNVLFWGHDSSRCWGLNRWKQARWWVELQGGMGVSAYFREWYDRAFYGRLKRPRADFAAGLVTVEAASSSFCWNTDCSDRSPCSPCKSALV